MEKAKPAYARIQDAIADRIQSGELPENAQLPTERALCHVYGASRITIRHALALLEKDGLIRRRQGQGIFVCPRIHEQTLGMLATFSQVLRRNGVRPSYRVLSFGPEDVEEDVEQILGLAKREQAIALRRLCYADDKLLGCEQIYVKRALLRSTSRTQLTATGLHDSILDAIEIYPDRATERFEATLADGALCRLFERKPPLPLMKLTRTSYLDGAPVEHCIAHILGEKCRFYVELSRGGI